MKKLLIVVIILLLAVLMTMTVPTKQTHKDAMMEAVREFVDEEADNRFGDNVLTDIGKSVAVKTVELALNTKLKEHNYLVLNTTYVKLNGEEHISRWECSATYSPSTRKCCTRSWRRL